MVEKRVVLMDGETAASRVELKAYEKGRIAVAKRVARKVAGKAICI